MVERSVEIVNKNGIHARPAAEIVKTAGKFKSHDEKTHQVARALEQAAVRSDGQAVISSFATLQNSCLACHQSFRKPFVEHFYVQR